jgi:4-hydroxy-tetrahydrodipicolinate synthase
MFSGVGVALITPFNDDLSIDYVSLAKVIDNCIAGGADYLVVNGTTGEASTLNFEEKSEILDFVANRVKSKMPLMYGIGANDTQFMLNLIKSTNFDHVDAVLTVAPYYNKPSQAGIVKHYESIADALPKPLFLYNVPSRTGINISTKSTLELAKHPNIKGVKEASGNITQCMEILKDRPSDFMLISGDDMLTTTLLSMGAEGVISVLANAFPSFTSLVHQAMKGQYLEANKALMEFVGFNDLLYAEGNPVGIKEVLVQQGVIKNNFRLPLLPASQQLSDQIKAVLPK